MWQGKLAAVSRLLLQKTEGERGRGDRDRKREAERAPPKVIAWTVTDTRVSPPKPIKTGPRANGLMSSRSRPDCLLREGREREL